MTFENYAALRSTPLFHEFTDDQLKELLAIFSKKEFDADVTLFVRGAVPTSFLLLIDGAVSVRDDDGERYYLRPVVPVGELGVLTSEPRNLTAITAKPSVFMSLEVSELQTFFESHGEIAFIFHRNMLRMTARKIGRDRRRQRKMRENIVNNQKAMKRMREALLESEDSPLHAALFEELDALIEHNRRIHYLVEPSRLVPTRVRLDGAGERWVTAISNEWLYFEKPSNCALCADSEWSGVLLLRDREIPICGHIELITDREVVVDLDPLIEQFDDELSEHLTHAQMLDVVL
jgi:CRP-like cAMP-binding protein